MLKLPSLVFAIVFLIFVTVTQLLTYQQYKISKEKEKNELIQEAAAAKDRFRNILFNDIAAANTLAIIYKQYGVPAKFDSVASQILNNSRYAQALQITENGIVKNVYPDARYKGTIGTNVNTDPLRKAEEFRAVDRKSVYFAGPRRLRFGDTGILGKVPIIVDNKVKAVATVLTRIAAIKKELGPAGSNRRKFAYQLLKIINKDTSSFRLSDAKPTGKNEYVDLAIPEGDWLLRTSYNESYATGRFPFEILGMGILLSFFAGLLAYRKAREPFKLNEIIATKTAQSNKANKELKLLNQINDIILHVDNEMQLYKEVCECIKITTNCQLAWIAYKPDANAADQVLVPLVAIGATEYLAGARIVLNDPELSNGPTAIALNTGKAVFNNDVANSTYFNPWLKRAETFGIRSSAALPFSLGDNKSGVLSIYSRYTNAFDEHERSILTRLAGNLSIAVQNIRNRHELAVSEDRFRGAFEESAIGMGLTSIEEHSMGRFMKVNRSLCEMLGYTEDELLSLTYMQITHPEDLAKDLAAEDRILSSQSGTYRLEKRNIRKDGSTIWINLNASLIKDKNGNPLYFVSQVENITEKVESQHKFQNLVENSIVGVYIIQDGKMVYVNPNIVEELGYTEEEVINTPFERFIYKDDIELVRGNIRERVNKNVRSSRYEARMVNKNGQALWYELLGSSIVYKGAPAQIGTMVNITERKVIYDDLEISEARLKSIFDSTNVCFLLLDRNYNIIGLNQQMHDSYMAAAGIALYEGANLIKAIAPERRRKAKASYDKVMKTSEPMNYETIYERDGKSMHFWANVKPLYDGKAITGVCISYVEITELQQALERLKHLNDNLERKAEELAASNADLEQSKKRYSELFNFSPLPVWVVNADTLQFLDVNNAAVQHYGFSREEFLSMTLKGIRPVEELANMERAVDETAKKGDDISRIVMVHQKKNGQLMNVEIQIAPIYYSGVKAYISVATDITEMQNYIRAIEAQNKRLIEISWIQSHIVRAPLSRIMGLIPMLEDADNTAGEQQTILEHILTSANELDEVIKTITEKSRTEDFQLLNSGTKTA